MSNEIAARETGIVIQGLEKAKYGDDKQFGNLATATAYLPFIQLYGAGTNLVKRGKIGMGRYGLYRGKENIEDLSAVVDVLVLSWRPKAMRFGGEEEVLSVFNPEHPEFKKIEEESEVADSGAVFGPEFLIYLPGSNPPCFATFYCSNKTSRREAPNMKGLIGRGATLKAHLIEGKKYSWHGPLVIPCSTPFQLPSMEEIQLQVQRFNNPPEKDLEAAPEGGSEERAR